jgi:hypothetical protein
MEQVIKEMLQDEVMIAPWAGQDAYGRPVYGRAVTYMGRVERHFQTMPSASGAQLVTETVLYLAEDAVIDERSQVTVEGRVLPIEGLKVLKDELGNLDHYQVFF